MARFLIAISRVFLIALLVGCGHNQDHFYRLRADAERSGEFQRGWLPDFLPRSSHDIRLIYDNSPSREWCGFEFDPTDADRLIHSLKPVDSHAPPIRIVTDPSVKWWPKFLEGDVDSVRMEQAGFFVVRPV